MRVEKSLALLETVHQLGFGSVEDFAVQKVKEKLLHDLKICSENIELFEKKYNMSYSEFVVDYTNLPALKLFEKEEDLQEWGAEIKLMRLYEKQISKL